MTDPIISDDAGAMGRIREDMDVVDQSGDKIGKVRLVKMGDPEAATAAGQTNGVEGNSIIGDLGEVVEGTEPGLPAPLAERLLREGFVRINPKGLFHHDLYASSQQVERVDEETVYLNVDKDSLATRSHS
jgi:hypothetical protein